jgi:hypothetical protein
VYTPLYDMMPAPILERTYRRLYEVLALGDTKGEFETLSATDRRVVLEILRETKPNLPAYWAAPQSE